MIMDNTVGGLVWGVWFALVVCYYNAYNAYIIITICVGL